MLMFKKALMMIIFAMVAWVLLINTAMANTGNSETLTSLSDLQWEYRVVLIQVESFDKGNDMVSVLKYSAAELDDRDIIWFVVANQQVLSNVTDTSAISSEFKTSVIDTLKVNSASIVLIGKDGGIKYRSPHIDLSVIFNRIDQVPMRRLEMSN